MSEISSNASPPADSGALLGKLLSNPDLIRNISSMLAATNSGDGEQKASAPLVSTSGNGEAMADGISRVLANPEMMAKLPDVMKMLAPMMQNAASTEASSAPASVSLPVSSLHEGDARDRRGCRNDLLIALKPFLSPERCRAIDMLLGLSRLGDVLQKMI